MFLLPKQDIRDFGKVLKVYAFVSELKPSRLLIHSFQSFQESLIVLIGLLNAYHFKCQDELIEAEGSLAKTVEGLVHELELLESQFRKRWVRRSARDVGEVGRSLIGWLFFGKSGSICSVRGLLLPVLGNGLCFFYFDWIPVNLSSAWFVIFARLVWPWAGELIFLVRLAWILIIHVSDMGIAADVWQTVFFMQITRLIFLVSTEEFAHISLSWVNYIWTMIDDL